MSSSVIPISSRLQSFPTLGSFPMSQFFTSGDQSIGVPASTSVLPMNIQDWFPLVWNGWSLLQYHSSKVSILWCSTFFIVQLWHPDMTTGKTKALTRWTFVGKVMSLFFIPNSSLRIFLLHRWKTLFWLLSLIKIRFPVSMTHFPLTVTAVHVGSREGFPGWSFPGEAVAQWYAWLPEWQEKMQHVLRLFLRNEAHKSGKRTSALWFQHIWAETPPPSLTDHLTISYLYSWACFLHW